MRRREFITLMGSAVAAWPVTARAQQSKPIIGFINAASAQNYARYLAAFLKGLGETGYVSDNTVTIQYRWAEGQNNRLPVMAADLVHLPVAVVAATSTPAALAAKAATATIPIVFEIGADPIKLGLVESLNRPAGNVTGITEANQETAPKRLELLHELLPTARVMGLLVNPANPVLAETDSNAVLAAAHSLGLELHVLNASTEQEFDAVFAKLKDLHASGLIIGGEIFLQTMMDSWPH
jgi:putative ABC transport system substrate-binding protein